MTGLTIIVDSSGLGNVAAQLRAAGKNAPLGLMRALNYTGARTKTQVVRALTAQTGLKRAVIVRAVRVSKASLGNASYVLRSSGGDISLKYFGARETRSGVSAAPRGRRSVYAGSFIKGGRFPNRVGLKMNGQVFEREGKRRLGITKLKSGVYIPTEMVTGATAAAFHGTVAAVLPQRLAHELSRLF